MDLHSVGSFSVCPGESLLCLGKGLQLLNLDDVRRHGILSIDTQAMSMEPEAIRVGGILPGMSETLKLHDSTAWVFKEKDIKVQVSDAVVGGEFVVEADAGWTPMKAGLQGTPTVRDLDAINRRGIIEVRIDGSSILVRGCARADGTDAKETISWWDESFGVFSSADTVTVHIVTCGLQPGVERDFVRELAKTVSADIKQSSSMKGCRCLPDFCDAELLKKIDAALKNVDKWGRIKWNEVFPDLKESNYTEGMKRLIEQLEFCLRVTEKSVVEKLVDLARKVVEKRTKQLDPKTSSYESHRYAMNFWKNNVVKRLEALRDKMPWAGSAGGRSSRDEL